jgi:acyl carrier protein
MSTDPVDTLAIVTDAVALVLELDAAQLQPATTFASLNADSLVLVGVADVVEQLLAARGRALRIDDASLSRMASLGDVVDYVDRAPVAIGNGSLR